MHSFSLLVAAGLVSGAVSVVPPAPLITPGPNAAAIDAMKRDAPDALSLANVLLTAVPESLRQIAATNIPAVSSILWSEFLDDNKPTWFTALPTDIQTYLVQQFGPKTAVSASATDSPNTKSSAASQSKPTSASSKTAETTSSRASKSAGSSGFSTSVTTPSTSDSTAGLPIVAAPTGTSAHPSTSPANSGLSKQQKIGIGVGVPLAILAVAALVAGCCLLLRRRRRKRNGSTPPPSPGFIPRFAFQEKSSADDWGPHHPLRGDGTHSAADLNEMEWDRDVIHQNTPSNGVQNGHQPIMAPAVFHSHSSNRARGKRTSYQSLHSVPEVPEHEPEPQSPVAARENPSRRQFINPPLPVTSKVKRKPVPKAGGPGTNNGALFPNANGRGPAASQLASQSLLQQHMGHNFDRASPTEERNPFGNEYSYVEDYGPEYHNGYNDVDTSYSGHPAFRQFTPESSRTEWPLRNGMNGHQRNKSPLWDRVYDGN